MGRTTAQQVKERERRHETALERAHRIWFNGKKQKRDRHLFTESEAKALKKEAAREKKIADMIEAAKQKTKLVGCRGGRKGWLHRIGQMFKGRGKGDN